MTGMVRYLSLSRCKLTERQKTSIGMPYHRTNSFLVQSYSLPLKTTPSCLLERKQPLLDSTQRFQNQSGFTAKETVTAKTAKASQRSILEDTSRFGGAVTDLETLAVVSKGFVPENTENNTQWALRVFQSWYEWRKSSECDDKVPDDGCP